MERGDGKCLTTRSSTNPKAKPGNTATDMQPISTEDVVTNAPTVMLHGYSI